MTDPLTRVPTCAVEGCPKPRRGREWCGKHYERWRKHGDPTTVGVPTRNRRSEREHCTIEGCGKAHKARGYCAMHYRRWHKHGDINYTEAVRDHPPLCSVEGCGQPWKSSGYCAVHYWRWAKRGDANYKVRVPGEKRWVTDSGYVMVQRRGHPNAHPSSGSIQEHRLVMAEKLGRPLYPNEHVHHINGVRADNRPENLELWLRHQPSGQRIEDLVAWARCILDRYGDLADGLRADRGSDRPSRHVG